MIAKRSRAHRSRCGRSSSALNVAPIATPSSAPLMGTKATKPPERRLSASSAGTSRPSDYLVMARVLKGAIKRSELRQPIRHRARHAKRSSRLVRQLLDQHRRHEPFAHRLPERRRRKILAPPRPPALQRARRDAEQLAQPLPRRAARRGGQHQHHRQIHTAAGKPHRRRSCAAVAPATGEAQAPGIILPHGGRTASGLAGVIRYVQRSAAHPRQRPRRVAAANSSSMRVRKWKKAGSCSTWHTSRVSWLGKPETPRRGSFNQDPRWGSLSNHHGT